MGAKLYDYLVPAQSTYLLDLDPYKPLGLAEYAGKLEPYGAEEEDIRKASVIQHTRRS